MKLIHTSDWHLGKMTASRSRLPDQEAFLYEFFLPLCDRERPDGVLLAGDVFDRSVAPAPAIRLFDGFIRELCAVRGIPLYTITGNHDGADRFALGAELLGRQGFHVASRLPERLEPISLDGGAARLFLLPYFDPPMARDRFPHREIRGFSDAFRAVLEEYSLSPCPGAADILLSHCFVAGAAAGESESPLYVGGSGEVDAGLFAPFDYVALGHLHSPQTIAGNCVYSGSPVKYAFDEEHRPKSVEILEITGGGITRRREPVTGQRDMRTVTGTLDEILENAAGDPARGDYIYANLEGPPVFEPMHRLRSVYPNILGMQYLRRGQEADGDGRGALRRSFKKGLADEEYIFTEFLRQICGETPTEADLRIFLDACAGGENAAEADGEGETGR